MIAAYFHRVVNRPHHALERIRELSSTVTLRYRSLANRWVPGVSRRQACAVIGIIMSMTYPAPSLLAQDLATPSTSGQAETCFDGRLRIRDLETADASLEDGLAAVAEEATAWEPDARLNTLRLGCPLLETGYQWEGTYFSETAQAFYSTDTGAVDAANDDPSTIETLDATNVDMVVIYRSLLRAGFDRDSTLGGTGVMTVKPSSEAQEFGPVTAPRGQDYAHVAIVQRGEVIDIWISIDTGTIYRYEGQD